ncbi:MAG: ThiF family adenylyltransferase [Candidatus Thorarchaeota archaeon]
MQGKYSESRYSRFVPLPNIGEKGMDMIRKAKVAIVGAGGLGSVTATQLVTLGVGYVRLFDKDVVETSNLQRQLLYRQKDVGKQKVVVAKKFLENLNPDVEIDIIAEKISADNVHLATEKVDFVVDALDRFTPRLMLNRECLKNNIPYLFGAVSGMNGNAMTVIHGSTCLECLFGHVKDENLPSNLDTGIHPAIIQIIGSLQVAEATRIMTAQKPLLVNHLLFCDIQTMYFESINVNNKANCICQK